MVGVMGVMVGVTLQVIDLYDEMTLCTPMTPTTTDLGKYKKIGEYDRHTRKASAYMEKWVTNDTRRHGFDALFNRINMLSAVTPIMQASRLTGG